MRVLLVSPTPSHPPNAGNRVRILALATAIRNMGHQVHFAYISMENSDEEAMANYWGPGYHPIPYKQPVIQRNTWQRLSRKIFQLMDPTHHYTFHIDDWFDIKAIQELRTL